MKNVRKILLLFAVCAAFHTGVSAQIDDIPPDEPHPDIPLDPGSWVLVAAGVGYGVKKWRDGRQKPSGNTDEATFFPNEK